MSIEEIHPEDCIPRTLGECRYPSPLTGGFPSQPTSVDYIDEHDRVLVDDTVDLLRERATDIDRLPSFEPSRPRRSLFFDPERTTAGIVTCGGLCPGLNDVVRGLVSGLRRHYGVSRILGFQHGYLGLTKARRDTVIELSGTLVRDIHHAGGTYLGTSRGHQDPHEMADTLADLGVDVLFVIGGDGSMRGAQELTAVLAERDLAIGVVGVPKTIDNDLPFIDQSFGFQTAVDEAVGVVSAALAEAHSVEHGVAIVKLMGRHSGFIAAHAAIAVNDVDFVLIPELDFRLDGEQGLFDEVSACVQRRGHAVIVVAEGAGQELLGGDDDEDASGNPVLDDIGALLSERIAERLTEEGLAPVTRYLDPSYAIRSVRAGTCDQVYCVRLAHAAVHAALAGRTEAVVAQWRRRFVLVPMALMTARRNKVDPKGELWASVLEATRQPTRLHPDGFRITPDDAS